jgi:hypothetical protein
VLRSVSNQNLKGHSRAILSLESRRSRIRGSKPLSTQFSKAQGFPVHVRSNRACKLDTMLGAQFIALLVCCIGVSVCFAADGPRKSYKTWFVQYF